MYSTHAPLQVTACRIGTRYNYTNRLQVKPTKVICRQSSLFYVHTFQNPNIRILRHGQQRVSPPASSNLHSAKYHSGGMRAYGRVPDLPNGRGREAPKSLMSRFCTDLFSENLELILYAKMLLSI